MHINELIVHFDKDKAELFSSEYSTSLTSFETVLNEINKKLFDNKINCRLIVITNEDGSFKAVKGILVKGVKTTVGAATVIALILSIAESSNVTGFIEGITKKEVHHYENGKQIGDLLHDLVVGIFETENNDLEQIIPNDKNFDKALKAKSNFYEMCHANNEIRAIGFSHEEHFPIKRNSFLKHTTKDKIRELDSDFLICDCIIISPVDVDKKLKWTIQESITQSKINAYMMDKTFKNNFLNGDYPLKDSQSDDKITVLLEYKKQEKNGESVSSDIEIKTVYSFNGLQIVEIPDDLPQGTKFIQTPNTPMDKLW